MIAQNWRNFSRVHKNPERFPEIFIGPTVYGNLTENIKSEFKYTEISGVGNYDSRYQRFIQQKPFLQVSSSDLVIQLAGGATFSRLAPVVTQMKDVSNMIVTDYLLNQADRIGNIHFKYKWYTLENGSVIDESSETKYIRGRDVIPADELSQASSNRVLVKEMVLKDNDCGISKDNEMKNVGALEKIRHMNPKVYNQLQKLADFVVTDAGAQYFTSQLRIRNDYFQGSPGVSSIKNNIVSAAAILKAKCQSGTLSLDLNLEELLVNPMYKASCESP